MDTIDILNSDRIKPLVKSGIAEILDVKYLHEFHNYICNNYPWEKYSGRINWRGVKHNYKRFKWENAKDEETVLFIKNTCLSNYNEICIFYEPSLPGLIIDFDFVCKNLAELTVFGWTTRFLIGVKRNEYNFPELINSCFLEIDFIKWLTASC